MTFKGNDLSNVVNEFHFSTYNSGATKKAEERCNK